MFQHCYVNISLYNEKLELFVTVALLLAGTVYIYIYVCRYVCLSWSKKRRQKYVGQTRACSKSVLCGKIRPVTTVLLGERSEPHTGVFNRVFA